MAKRPGRWGDWVWRPFEFLQESFTKGSRANLQLGVLLFLIVAALTIFGVGR